MEVGPKDIEQAKQQRLRFSKKSCTVLLEPKCHDGTHNVYMCDPAGVTIPLSNYVLACTYTAYIYMVG